MKTTDILRTISSLLFIAGSLFVLLMGVGVLSGRLSALVAIGCSVLPVITLGLASYVRFLYEKLMADEEKLEEEHKRERALEKMMQKQAGLHY